MPGRRASRSARPPSTARTACSSICGSAPSQDRAAAALARAGHPVVTIKLIDALRPGRRVRALGDRDCGRLCTCSSVHPFDEPETRRARGRDAPPAGRARRRHRRRRPLHRRRRPTSRRASARIWRRRAAGATSRSRPSSRARRDASGSWRDPRPRSASASASPRPSPSAGRAALDRSAARGRTADRDRARPDRRRGGRRPIAARVAAVRRHGGGATRCSWRAGGPLLRIHLGRQSRLGSPPCWRRSSAVRRAPRGAAVPSGAARARPALAAESAGSQQLERTQEVAAEDLGRSAVSVIPRSSSVCTKRG